LQLLRNICIFDMDLATAVEAPRFATYSFPRRSAYGVGWRADRREKTMKRRDLLIGSGAAVGGSLLRGFRQSVFAQAKPAQMVLMTWGGLWGDAMRDGAGNEFEKQTGIKIIQDRSGSPADRITKIKVNINDQKFDLVQLHDGLVPLAITQGALEPLDKVSPRLTNLNDVPPRFVQSHWVAMIFSPLGIIYNAKLVEMPPRSFADLWRPEFKRQVVLPEITHSIGPYIIPIGAIASGKPPTNTEAGFEMLKKMVDQQPIWAKDTDTIMNALRGEDAVIGLLYKSQTYTVKDWKVPVGWVYPKEGAILYSSGTAIAKGTKHLEFAEQFLNLTLDPKIQTIYAEKFNYPGTNMKMEALLPPYLQERVRSTPEEMNRLIELDHAMLAEKRPEWTDRWNRIVAGG
jgi:putative spermidine/putrescine transport system substrate-binding protein